MTVNATYVLNDAYAGTLCCKLQNFRVSDIFRATANVVIIIQPPIEDAQLISRVSALKLGFHNNICSNRMPHMNLFDWLPAWVINPHAYASRTQ